MKHLDIDYKHHWELDRTAWFVRFYLWLTQASDKNITFCRLFWAYFLIWLFLPFRLLIMLLDGVGWLVRRIPKPSHDGGPVRKPYLTHGRVIAGRDVGFKLHNLGLNNKNWKAVGWYLDDQLIWGSAGDSKWADSLTPGKHEIRVEIADYSNWVFPEPDPSDPYDPRGYHVPEHPKMILTLTVEALPTPLELRVLDAVAAGMARGVMALRSARMMLRPVARVVLVPVALVGRGEVWVLNRLLDRWRLLLVLLGAFWLGLMGGAVYAGIETGVPLHGPLAATGHWLGNAAVNAAPYLVVGVIAVAFSLLTGILLARWIDSRDFEHPMKVYVWACAFGRGVKAFGRGIKGFGRMMLIGYKVVKSNTCPKVVLK